MTTPDRRGVIDLVRSHPVVKVYGAIFAIDFITKLDEVFFRFYYTKEHDEERGELVLYARRMSMDEYYGMEPDQMMAFYIFVFNEALKAFKIQEVGEE